MKSLLTAVVAYVLVLVGGHMLVAGAWLYRLANRIDGSPADHPHLMAQL